VAVAAILESVIFMAIADAQRPEMLSTVLLLVWILLLPPQNKPLHLTVRLACAVITFLLPLCHPVTMVCVPVLLGWRFLLGTKEERCQLVPHLLACGLGLVMVGLWFSSPLVLSQFVDHSAVAKAKLTHLRPWTSLVAGLDIFYGPFWVGGVFYAAGAFFCAVSAGNTFFVRKKMMTREDFLARDGAGLALLVVLLSAKFYNIQYFALVYPLFVIEFLVFIVRTGSRKIFAIILVLALLAGANNLARKSGRALLEGAPDVRESFIHLTEHFPTDRTVFIPEILWEVPLKRSVHFVFNTLPHESSFERRRAYEAYVYEGARKGDWLVLDDYQFHTILRPITAEEWELKGVDYYHFSGKGGGKAKLTIYEKK
jgi:hypothetical protein